MEDETNFLGLGLGLLILSIVIVIILLPILLGIGIAFLIGVTGTTYFGVVITISAFFWLIFCLIAWV